MAFVIPNEGELRLLNELLDGNLAREPWTLDLLTDATAASETDVASTHTKVTTVDSSGGWPGYTATTLTRTVGSSTWNTPANGAPTDAWSAEASVAESAYGSAPITYTNNGTNQVTVTGYQIVGATSTKCIAVAKFATSAVLNAGGQLQLTPRFGFS